MRLPKASEKAPNVEAKTVEKLFVLVPDIMFEHRRIYLEVINPRDIPLARHHAGVLSKIMTRQLYAEAAKDSATGRPIIVPGFLS